MTTIEWTDKTWNPTTGCDQVSPGCDHCYALTLAKRLKAMGSPKYQADGNPATSGPGFALTVHPDTIDLPHTWKHPQHIFVNSMSDLFHPAVPEPFIDQIYETMALTPRHTYQILTKRPHRLQSYLRRRPVLPNVWLGVSIENDRYQFRAHYLRHTPAAVRFLSCEPLLGPLPDLNLEGIDWVIVGGESGPGARPMDINWVREIRDRCIDTRTAFFFKQWGRWAPTTTPDGYAIRRGGNHASGRTLDGRTWDQYPETAPA